LDEVIRLSQLDEFTNADAKYARSRAALILDVWSKKTKAEGAMVSKTGHGNIKGK
jgi:hypothetical protein